MKAKFSTFTVVYLMTFFCSNLFAQSTSKNLKIYDKDGLSFSYPETWELTEQSTPEMQQLKLAPAKSSALIYINSPRSLVTTEEQFYEARETITDRFAENIKLSFTGENRSASVKEENICSKVDKQIKLRTVIYGSYRNQPGTAEIHSAIIEHRFVNLIFIRNDKDNEEVNPAWQKIVETLKAVTPNAKHLTALATYNIIPGGVLNGKAVSLPRPPYPSNVRIIRGSVRVPVVVTIDETGKVINARARPGNVERQFLSMAEQAAKKARFSITYLCGEPVRVTGIIVYNFVR